MRGVGSLASIFLSSSEHLVYEQDKLGNKQKIESPLPALTGARDLAGSGNNKENIWELQRKKKSLEEEKS